MNYSELKPLLRQGDCKEVAEICNLSTTFVQNVWRGKTTGTLGAECVWLATKMKIAERKEYTLKIKNALVARIENWNIVKQSIDEKNNDSAL